jgi:hypothetical protein
LKYPNACDSLNVSPNRVISASDNTQTDGFKGGSRWLTNGNVPNAAGNSGHPIKRMRFVQNVDTNADNCNHYLKPVFRTNGALPEL